MRFTTSSGGNGVCELADLLVVVDDLTSGVPTTRRAVLVQAKMAAAGGGKTLSSGPDLVQLDLYSNWPSFTLPLSFAAGSRDFSKGLLGGSGALDSGRYGLIEPQLNPRWTQQAPAQVMQAGGDELGSYMAHVVQSGGHRYGRVAPGTGDDWSTTISELLSITGGLSFSYRAGFQGRRPRKNVQVALMLSEGIYSTAPFYFRDVGLPVGGRPEGPGDEGAGEERGISLIHIGVERLDDGEV